MKKEIKIKEFMKAGVSVVICTVLIATSFSAAVSIQEFSEYEHEKNMAPGLNEVFNEKAFYESKDDFQTQSVDDSGVTCVSEGDMDFQGFDQFSGQPEFEDDVILVKFKSGFDVDSLERALSKIQDVTSSSNVTFATVVSAKPAFSDLTRNREKKSAFGLDRWLKIKVDGDIFEEVEKYKNNPFVEYAQLNYIMTHCLVPNDPFYHSSGSWGRTTWIFMVCIL